MGKKIKKRGNVLILLLVAALAPWLIASCGLHSGIEQSAERSYLRFTGNVSGAFVSIDRGEAFDLAKGMQYTDEEGNKITKKNMLFEIKPGKHTINISREGQVVVNRVFLIGNNQTKEIVIP